MKLTSIVIMGFLLAGAATAQNGAPAKTATAGHPDLNGVWTYAIDLAPSALRKTENGKTSVVVFDQSARHKPADNMPGTLPWTKTPSYKPELREKVKYLADHESKEDNVFFCGKPGVPRIGSPRRIVQLPNEVIFFYEDISGDPYRIIPTDGRKHRADANPSFYGDSVGHWEGGTLVVEATSFSDEGWFGEDGYFHSDAMRVTERFSRQGDNLLYQATVDDPKVLTEPWTNFPRLIKPSTEPLEESPVCKEDDAHRLLNNDHHGQR